MHGYGIFKWPDGVYYEGNYVNDKKNGYGKYFWSVDVYYEGNWLNSKQHGLGKYYNNEKCVEGNFRHGRLVNVLNEEVLERKQNC